VQFTPGSLAVIAGLLVVLIAGGATVAARSGGERNVTLRIESLVDPTPSSAQQASASSSGRRQQATASPSPTPEPTPPPPRSVFDTHQIVAYYGNPYSATMGILGEFNDKQSLLRRLEQQVATHQALNPDKAVVPAFHLIYAVAQGSPGADGTYLLHMPDEMVEEFIEFTREHNMIFFIDLQNGKANPVEEVKRIRHWLSNEHVHLAMDPEFTLLPHENPRDDIGELDGKTINEIQDLLQQVALENHIGNKIFIIHQFRSDMITNKNLIATDRDRVDIVINMDGWGPPPGKLSKYELHVRQERVEYAGIKIFYRWDQPLLTEAEIQALDPKPNYIQYQ
jgi:hypothetical protein